MISTYAMPTMFQLQNLNDVHRLYNIKKDGKDLFFYVI